MKPKLLDFIAALLIVILSVLCAIPTFARDDGTVLEVYRDGDVTSLPLKDGEFLIEHGEYSLTLVISGGAVTVTDSNCPDGLCELSPAISRAGETIVCLPAKVILRISGEKEGELDGIAG